MNMQNKDDECFRLCNIRHLNPQDRNPERVKKVDKRLVNDLYYSGV